MTSKTKVTLLSALALIAATVALGFGTRGAEAAFPGNNGLIVFSSYDAGDQSGDGDGPNRIEVMNPDGTGRRILLTISDLPGPGVQEEIAYPEWSADGTMIAFSARDEDSSGATETVWIMNADGSNPHAVVTSMNAKEPVWSPDGTKLAFTNDDGSGHREIWIVNTDGTGLRSLVTTGNSLSPAWSPNGSQIAFAQFNETTSRFDIWVVNADGSNPHALFDAQTSAHPEWSPDGAQIAFEYFSAISSEYSLWVMNADGSNPHALFTSGWGFHPAWSPDGTQIVFTGGDVDRDQIWMMNADGSNSRALITARTGERFFSSSWQPVPADTPTTSSSVSTTTVPASTTTSSIPSANTVRPRFAG